MKSQGFSLIEFCLYLLLLTMIVTISFKWLAMASGPSQAKQARLDALIDLHLARDLLASDIRKGSINSEQWINDGSRILSKTLATDVCWECRQEKLFRITGQYQTKTGQWSNKKQAVIAQGITKFLPQIHKDATGFINEITVTIANTRSECVLSASPRVARKVA